MTKEVPRTSVLRDEELIARLREIQGQAGLFASAAADRIEKLVERNKELALQLLATQGQAADRIELLATTNEQLVATNEALSISNATLIAERDEALEWLSASQGYIADAVYALDKQEAAEAKLEKAVKALELIVVDNTWGLEHQTYMKCRKALAEIKSGVATTPYGLEGESHD